MITHRFTSQTAITIKQLSLILKCSSEQCGNTPTVFSYIIIVIGKIN